MVARLSFHRHRVLRHSCLYYIKTNLDVKFSLYLKKAGLASTVQLQNHPTLCRFLLYYPSFLLGRAQKSKFGENDLSLGFSPFLVFFFAFPFPLFLYMSFCCIH